MTIQEIPGMLPLGHSLARCRSPLFHGQSSEGARRAVQAWAFEKFDWATWHPHDLIVPLCCGGGPARRYIGGYCGRGSYCYCNSCHNIDMVGWSDSDPLPHPKKCSKCHQAYQLGNYFINLEPDIASEMWLDHDHDGLLAVLEVLAQTDRQLSAHELEVLLVRLSLEGRLRYGQLVSPPRRPGNFIRRSYNGTRYDGWAHVVVEATGTELRTGLARQLNLEKSWLLYFNYDWDIPGVSNERYRPSVHGRAIIEARKLKKVRLGKVIDDLLSRDQEQLRQELAVDWQERQLALARQSLGS